MPRDVLSLLESGNKAQLEKLKENLHKENWEDLTFEELYDFLHGEEDELYNEVCTPEGEWIEKPDLAKVRKEAADVANFSHMIIQYCDKQLKK